MIADHEDPRRYTAPPERKTTETEDRESIAHYKSLTLCIEKNPEGRGLNLDMDKIRRWSDEAHRADHDNKCAREAGEGVEL